MQPLHTFTSSVLTPYERGVELGERQREGVRRTAAAYRRLFQAHATRPFDVDDWAERAWAAITELAPWATPEIEGIAEGAGLPAREVAAVNARTELLAAADPGGVGECSSVVVLPPDGRPVVVQTWDWYDAMRDNWLCWRIPHPDGRVVETVTEFGMLAKIGAARTAGGRGVGVLLNMLHHAEDGKREDVGYPVHLLSRHILDRASDLDEALVMTKSAGTSASTSLTVVESAGHGARAVSIELSPAGVGLVEPSRGLLVRTNHFLTEPLHQGCLADRIGPGSRIRRRTLLEALGTTRPRSAADVVAAMHDHRDEGGVCVHPDQSAEPLLRHATLATVALDMAAGTVRATPGGPCART